GARLLAAFFLTDGAFAVAAGQGRLRLPVLIGAGVSMYTAWNAGTAIGLIAGRALLSVRGLGIDFVLPLIFLALLIPLVRSRPTLAVALIAGLGTIVLARIIPPGLAVLMAGITASLSGVWWSQGSANASDNAAQQIASEDR
ncbi:MAG TPA: AzlC family ABC transporter permease, partial [Thermomicrobiales bacterium]